VAYDYYVTREDVSFSPESVFYKNRQEFRHNSSRSRIDEDAQIVTLNVPFIVITSMLDNLPAFMIDIIKRLLKDLNYTTFTARTVKELLWGYEDPLLKKLHQYLPHLVNDGEFGFFLNYNNSLSEEFEADSGMRDIHDWCQVRKWNNRTSLGIWNSEWANEINGTDGFGISPMQQDASRLFVFIDAVCRSVYVDRSRSSPSEYVLEEDVFASADKNADNIGFCPEGICAPSGVLNVTSCVYMQTGTAAPVFISQPHFFQGDQSLSRAVDGMEPNETLHRTFLSLDPMTGFIKDAAKRLQINVFAQGLSRSNTGIFFPAIWFDQRAKPTAEFSAAMSGKISILYLVQRFPVCLMIVSLLGLLFSVPFLPQVKIVRYEELDQDNDT